MLSLKVDSLSFQPLTGSNSFTYNCFGFFQPRSSFYSPSSSSSFHGEDSSPHGGGGPKEPEFVTHNQLIEVVLGDTVILPCKIANIGNIKHLILQCVQYR